MVPNDAFPPSSGLAEFEQPQSDEDQTYSPTDLDIFDWNLWSANSSSISVQEEQNNAIFDPAALEDIDLNFGDFDSHAPEITTQEPASLGGEFTTAQTHSNVYLPLEIGSNPEAPWEAGPSAGGSPRLFSSSSEVETTSIQPPSVPRRRGRLSDVVRKGIEELVKSGGACWRCKILRKKVRIESLKIWQVSSGLSH